MLGTAVLAAALALPVHVVDELRLEDVEGRAAVGLVVPGAGPETSREIALASLRCGEVVNSLREREPECADPIELRTGMPDGPAIVLQLPRGGRQANDERYPIALVGADGVLTSDSTRLDGIVSIADVAAGELETAPGDAEDVRALDGRIADNGTARLPAGLIAAAIIVVMALKRPRAAVSAFATGALANLVLGVLGISEPWLTVPLIALGTAAGVLAAPSAWLLAGTIAAYLVAMAVDPAYVALSPLGPTQNSRFYGISNLLETMLLVPALAGAWLAGRRWLVPVAALALVMVAGSRFGADGGGALVLAAGFAVLVRGRWSLALAGLAVVLVAVDALVGPSTHVGESLRDGSVFSDLRERLELSWERATDGPLVALATAAALAALAVLVARGPRHPLAWAFAAAIGVSLLVNDSPQDVAVGGLVGYLAVAGYTSTDEAARIRT